jgi:hypothetical protein
MLTRRGFLGIIVAIAFLMFGAGIGNAAWEPPSKLSREGCVKISQDILARPDMKIKQKEDVFRLQRVGMDWDIGVMVYEPEDAAKVPKGADGKKVGFLLLPGGDGDWRSMEKLARLLSGKYGFKVVSMTYPGRLYLQDASRNWPGDTIHPDGTVRVPIWKKDELIAPDQYDVVKDTSKRSRYGTRIVARAKPGTTFYYRMAGWPIAFEEGMKEACKRHLPEGEYSIYGNGHSTGGPFMHMILQRIPNMVGMADAEGSPFGYIYSQVNEWSGSLGKIGNVKVEPAKMDKDFSTWPDPFYELAIRSWRDIARYSGPEALGQQGAEALMRLPWLMEEVFEEWEQGKMEPNFKAEYIVTRNGVKQLSEAAQVTAKRLNMGPGDTEALVKRFVGYTRELSGPGIKPVPPILYNIAKDSRDHSPDAYQEVILPMLGAMKPAPKVHVVEYGAGVHGYTKAEKDLPLGIAPAITKTWYDAIMGGYFVK